MSFIDVQQGLNPQSIPTAVPIGGIVYRSTVNLAANGVATTGWIDTSLYGSLLYVLRSNVGSATTSGIMVEYSYDASTDTGTSAGNPVFTSVVVDSIMLTAVSSTMPLSYGTPVVSNDKKSLTVPVFQPSTQNSVATVLGIQVLTGVNLVPAAAANGVTVRMILQGIE